MTRIYYFLVIAMAVCGISARFFVKRFLEKNPLVKDKPLVKKLLQSSWLSFISIFAALVGFLYINYVMKVRLAQSWENSDLTQISEPKYDG